jgi:hypothetical protein
MNCERCAREIARLKAIRDRAGSILLPAWERADLKVDNAQRAFRKGRHVCGGEKGER